MFIKHHVHFVNMEVRGDIIKPFNTSVNFPIMAKFDDIIVIVLIHPKPQ